MIQQLYVTETLLLQSVLDKVYCVSKGAFFFALLLSLSLSLDAGLLVRSQYSEGPATGHLDTGFLGFPVPKSKC